MVRMDISKHLKYTIRKLLVIYFSDWSYPNLLSMIFFATDQKLLKQDSHLFPGTFYHLHFHGKFAVSNHGIYVFLIIHFCTVISISSSIYVHTVFQVGIRKSLLNFVKEETSTQKIRTQTQYLQKCNCGYRDHFIPYCLFYRESWRRILLRT